MCGDEALQLIFGITMDRYTTITKITKNQIAKHIHVVKGGKV